MEPRNVIVRILLPVLVVLAMSTGVQTQELREVPASEILEKIQAGEDVNYTNVRVTGELDLSGIELETMPIERSNEGLKIAESEITIINSVFENNVDFSKTRFRKTLDFHLTSFSNISDFKNANFSADANFWGANFSGYTNFAGADFGSYTNFNSAKFSANANFWGANFGDYTNFAGADFGSYTNFNGAKFSADADFRNADFYDNADFQHVYFSANANFWGAKFSADANFQNANFSDNANFESANFGSYTNFVDADFYDNANFQYADFYDNADFQHVYFSADADFRNADFYDNADFQNADFYANANFQSANFGSYTDFTGADFSADANFQHVYFSGNADFRNADFGDAADFKYMEFGHDIIFDKQVYIKLIKDFRDNALFDDANSIYYQYRKQESRAIKGVSTLYLLDVLMWFFCGYGVRPWYAVVWGVAIISICALIYWVGGGIKLSKESEESDEQNAFFCDVFYFTMVAFTIVGFTYLSRDCGVTLLYTIILATAMIWIYILHRYKLCFFRWQNQISVTYKQWRKSLPTLRFRGLKKLNLWRSEVYQLENNIDKKSASFCDAFYFSVTTFTTLSYGDWYPRNYYRILAVIEGLLGWLILALFLVTLANVMIRP